MYYANNTIKGETISETTFDFEDGEQVSTQKLEYKGKVYNGKLILHANGEVAVCIDDEEHYAYKNKDTDEIVSGNGTCLYDGTTGDFSSNSSINDLRGKTVVATDVSESEAGLSTLITIPEEGHYDETSIISVSNNQLSSSDILGTIWYYGCSYSGISVRGVLSDSLTLNGPSLTVNITGRIKIDFQYAGQRGAGAGEAQTRQNSILLNGTTIKTMSATGLTSASFTSFEIDVSKGDILTYSDNGAVNFSIQTITVTRL